MTQDQPPQDDSLQQAEDLLEDLHVEEADATQAHIPEEDYDSVY